MIATIATGHYQTDGGDVVKFSRPRVRRGVEETVTVCRPHVTLPGPEAGREAAAAAEAESPAGHGPVLTLFQGGALEAAEHLVGGAGGKPGGKPGGRAPCVLDFASDSNPGGGWRSKQQGTQEEELCRSSSLGVCLETHFERTSQANYMPSMGVVYAPEVLVLRRGSRRGGGPAAFTDTPFWIAVVAAALRITENVTELDEKIEGVIRVCAHHGHRQVVLGAWGCGAFGNDPTEVARRMVRAVGRFRGAFDHIVFAIPRGKSSAGKTGGANYEAFADALPSDADVVVPSDAEVAQARDWEDRSCPGDLRWQLATLLAEPELVVGAAESASVSAGACRNERRVRGSLLASIKRICIAQVASMYGDGVGGYVATRLESTLPPVAEEGRGSGGGGDGGGGGGDGDEGVVEEYRRARRDAVAQWMAADLTPPPPPPLGPRPSSAIGRIESSRVDATVLPEAGDCSRGAAELSKGEGEGECNGGCSCKLGLGA